MKVTDKYVFFWKGWLSNFWRAPFTIDVNGTQMRFFCTEQYFMYMKALTFRDQEIGEKILKCNSPQEARKLGQQVRGYSDSVWGPIREQVMFDANLAKYRQNKDVRDKLLDPSFAGKGFVEASPYDRIWAIGIGEDDPRVLDPRNWLGTNLLGKCLDKVREELQKEKVE